MLRILLFLFVALVCTSDVSADNVYKLRFQKKLDRTTPVTSISQTPAPTDNPTSSNETRATIETLTPNSEPPHENRYSIGVTSNIFAATRLGKGFQSAQIGLHFNRDFSLHLEILSLEFRDLDSLAWSGYGSWKFMNIHIGKKWSARPVIQMGFLPIPKERYQESTSTEGYYVKTKEVEPIYHLFIGPQLNFEWNNTVCLFLVKYILGTPMPADQSRLTDLRAGVGVYF